MNKGACSLAYGAKMLLIYGLFYVETFEIPPYPPLLMGVRKKSRVCRCQNSVEME